MKISQGEKKLFWSVTSAFVILGGGYGWRSYLNREPVVNIPPYPKLPSPNGFDIYLKAHGKIRHLVPPVDEIVDPTAPKDPKLRAQRYSLARREAWLRQNAAGFQLIQKALKTPCLHPEQRTNEWWPFPAHSQLRELARRIKIRAHTQEMRGDWNGAMQSRLDAVQMGIETSRGGPVIPFLVGVAVQSVGRSGQWPIIEKMNAKQCRAATTRLEEMYARRLKLDEVLTEEKYCNQTQFIQMMRDKNWRVSLWHQDEFPLRQRLNSFFVTKTEIVQSYGENMDRQIVNAKQPYVASKIPMLPTNDLLSEMWSTESAKLRINSARNDAANALWLVCFALRTYRLENGKYPANLKELTPKYLKAIPTDPFGGGESLRYKRTGNDYSLYSIGPDGVDNGGRPITHGAKASAKLRKDLPIVDFDSKGDYVAGKNR